ncbi:MAG: hypothetical protein KC503_15450 [Myxococcales bacterium]|nr:hypothetical protein [Myxococcales bacterium]
MWRRPGGIAVSAALLVLLLLGVAWSLGWLDGLTVDLGDSGEPERRSAERRARAARFIAIGEPRSERATPSVTLSLPFDDKHCYALALGSGRRLRRVVLERLGVRAFDDEVARRWALTTYCPRIPGRYSARVTLEQPGWLNWRLMERPRRAKK